MRVVCLVLLALLALFFAPKLFGIVLSGLAGFMVLILIGAAAYLVVLFLLGSAVLAAFAALMAILLATVSVWLPFALALGCLFWFVRSLMITRPN